MAHVAVIELLESRQLLAATLSGIDATPVSYSVNNDSTSNRPAAPVTSTLAVTDAVNITSATVQITGNYQQGQDTLAFTNTATITGHFDSATGTMTLTGSDTAANYQAALRSVTYSNASASITGQTRTLTFIATDTTNTASNSVTRDISVTSSTVVSGVETTPLAYTEGQAATPVTSSLTLSDANGTTVSGATVKISSGLQTGDVLAFANTAKITGNYVAATGVLTLSGTDTLADYQAALRSITFQNTSNPSTAARTVSFQVGTTLLTTAVTRNINVTADTTVPVISGIEHRRLRIHHHGHERPNRQIGPAVVAPALTLSIPGGSTTLTGATVKIGRFHAGQDVLAFTATGNITGTFDAKTGILTLSGTDTVANYQQVLRSVTFDSSGPHSRGPRDITFEVSNGAINSVAASRRVRVGR